MQPATNETDVESTAPVASFDTVVIVSSAAVVVTTDVPSAFITVCTVSVVAPVIVVASSV